MAVSCNTSNFKYILLKSFGGGWNYSISVPLLTKIITFSNCKQQLKRNIKITFSDTQNTNDVSA